MVLKSHASFGELPLGGGGSTFLIILLRELWNLALRSHASLGGHPRGVLLSPFLIILLRELDNKYLKRHINNDVLLTN